MRFLLFFILTFISCDKNSSSPLDNSNNYPSDWCFNDDGVICNYNNYQNNGSITSAIFMNEVNVVSQEDILAAYVDDEVRGIAIPIEVPFGPYEGTYQFLMMVYSNASSGESIQFKFYDSQNDTVLNIIQTYDFTPDMILGDVINPIEFYIE